MLDLKDLERILAQFRAAKSESQLHDALHDAILRLGFAQFALGHHVDLERPPEQAIRLSNYNEDWISHVLEKRYFMDDPIHFASTRTACGFLWHDVENLVRLSPRQKQILTEAVAFGLGAGFTVPVHLPGEYRGTCSFGAPSLDGLDANALPIAQLCGTFAFEAARRIMRQSPLQEQSSLPDLTPRQREALVLVGRGKTDAGIGDILGVSRATAHEHVEGVRRAYGNAQRAYMIVRALFDGQIAFAGLLRR